MLLDIKGPHAGHLGVAVMVTLSLQALREGPLPAVPAVGAAGSGVRAGDEGAPAPAAVGRVQGEGAGRPAGPSTGAPVRVPAPRGVRRPLPGGARHKHLPGHSGEPAPVRVSLGTEDRVVG